MRFLPLLFLCLSHLALSVEYSTPLLTINGISYKNATISYEENSTTAKIFHESGVLAITISQIPHSILPNLNLSKEKVAKIITDNQAKFKKSHDELKRKDEISKKVDTEKKRIYQTLKNSLRINFYPIDIHPEIPHCYIGHPAFPRTKKLDKSMLIAVLTSPPLELWANEKVFSLKKLYSIMTIDASPIIYKGKEITTLLYTCDAHDYNMKMYLYKTSSKKKR